MYKVLIDTLNHNGRKRVPGELIDMNEEDAAPLIKIGAIEASAVTANQSPGSGGQDNLDPETGNTDDGNPAQPQPQATAAESGGADASRNAVQEQLAGSAAADSGAGLGAAKSAKKESKPKAR